MGQEHMAPQEMQRTKAELFMQNYQPLETERAKQAFDAQRFEDLRKYHEQNERRKQLAKNGEVEEPAPLRELVVTQEEYREPELGKKEKSRKSKKMTKDLQRGMKLSKDATCYTAPIMEFEQKQKEQKEKGKIPEPDNSPQGLAELKEKVLSVQYNANKFEAGYFGEHYAQVKEELEDLKRFTEQFNPESEAFKKLKDSEKARAKVLTRMLPLMEDCYEATLAMHCIRVRDGEFRAKETRDEGPMGAVKANYLEKGRALKEFIGNSDRYVVEEIYENEKRFQTQGMDEMQRVMAEEHPLVKGKYFSPYAYEGIDKFLTAMNAEKNAERYEENKALIDSLLSDYIKMQEVMGDYSLEVRVRQMVTTIIDQEGGHMQSEAAAYKYSDRLSDEAVMKQSAYMARLTDLEFCLNYLLKGNADIPESSWRVLKQYGFAPAAEKVEEGKKEAEYYRATVEMKYDLLGKACEKKFADLPEEERKAKLSRYTTGTLGRAVMLMDPENEAYNDFVLDYQVRVDRLSMMSKEEKETEEGKALQASISKDAETLLTPKHMAIMDYQVPELSDLTHEKLISMQEEVHELVLAGMMLSDLGKVQSDIPGISVKDKILGKPPVPPEGPDDPAYQSKLAAYQKKADKFRSNYLKLEGIKQMSRAAALMSGMASEGDPMSYIVESTELGKLEQFTGMERKDQLILFARSMMDKGVRTYESGPKV